MCMRLIDSEQFSFCSRRWNFIFQNGPSSGVSLTAIPRVKVNWWEAFELKKKKNKQQQQTHTKSQ